MVFKQSLQLRTLPLFEVYFMCIYSLDAGIYLLSGPSAQPTSLQTRAVSTHRRMCSGYTSAVLEYASIPDSREYLRPLSYSLFTSSLCFGCFQCRLLPALPPQIANPKPSYLTTNGKLAWTESKKWQTRCRLQIPLPRAILRSAQSVVLVRRLGKPSSSLVKQ